MSPAAIAALAGELKALRARKDSSLRMVVAGSCLSEERECHLGLAFNECVVLGALGQTLCRGQRKLNHYAMKAARMTDYGLHAVDSRDHKEHTQSCRFVQIPDGRLGRMLVLICEDLAQARPGDRVLDAFQPDWVFTPVLDGEIRLDCWIDQRAWPKADRFGRNGLVAMQPGAAPPPRPDGDDRGGRPLAWWPCSLDGRASSRSTAPAPVRCLPGRPGIPRAGARPGWS